MKQVQLFATPTLPGSLTGKDIPQDTVELRGWVCDERFIKENSFPTWRYCDWGNRYGTWAKDYAVSLIGVGEKDIAYAKLPCGRIDEFGLFDLFPIKN